MSTSVSTPAPRDMAQEGRDTLQAQVDLAPDIYAARAKYDPQYAALNVQTLRQALLGTEAQPGLLSLYSQIEPQLTDFAAKAQTGQRTRDIADVAALAPQATAAFRAADPTAAAIEDQLAQQAQAELASGASLDPALANQVSQSVRAAQAARGFGMGVADANVEGLFLGREAEALRRQRQAFATDVAARRRATTGDPFLAILGRPATAVGLSGQALGQAGAAASGGQSFDPFNAYGADLYNTNYNADAAAKIATANNRTALLAAGIQAAGSVGGGMGRSM